MRKSISVLAVSALQATCTSAPPQAPSEPQPSSGVGAHTAALRLPNPDGQARLSRDVVPVAYSLRFEVDPRLDHFTGQTSIRVRLAKPTRRIALHARNLTVGEATITGAAGTHVASVTYGPNAGLALDTDAELSGVVDLRFSYTGTLTETPESLYRVQEEGRWYAYTQFESLMAREAFPCFDEPGFKAPFDVTIVAPREMVAVANTPEIGVEDAPPSGAVARRAHRFQTTRPLPTYLVALAVGDFDVVDAPIGTLSHRLLATKGKGAQTAYFAEQAPKVLGALTNYFGAPYPFEKLDQIAVPNFNSGAMENVGLVTYRERLLLVDAERGNEWDKVASRSVMAHELAHMWFGNLVTMKWWDDTWLNEAFATWMANKVMTEIAPEIESDAYAVTSMLAVMGDDALGSAAPVRKTIQSDGDIRNAFDWITYAKGFAVLRMLENWLGATELQTAIRQYMSDFAYANADMADFVGVVERSTGKPVRAVVESFVLEPGVPEVGVTLQCTEGHGSATVTQKRYVPRGVSAPPSKPWTLPLCLSLVGTKVSRQCTLIREATQTVALDGPCPSDVYPNADEASYYHWHVPPTSLVRLSTTHRKKLSLNERIALPAHARALFESGAIDATTFLTVLGASAKDDHRLVVEQVLIGLSLVERSLPRERDAALARVTRKWLGRHVQRVGLSPRKGEPLAHTLLRQALFSSYYQLTEDPEIERKARDAMRAYVEKPDAFDDSAVKLLLPIAARRGDAALHAALVAQLEQGVSATRRHALIAALAQFEDPALLRKTLDLVLAGTIRGPEYGMVAGISTESRRRFAVYWQWYRENEARLIPLLGPHVTRGMPRAASGHCTVQGKSEALQHFQDLSRFGSGAQRHLDQTLEAIDRCVALREGEGAHLVAALASLR